uniref:Uncharacterized protein n=1 Tax=Magnetococcus massalia (strain MO-1) TaxID=451514 RepID=A0A1S7LML2_MAGMO|nr:exported protein of unknown function [Candidatus Magnetococcus massalia]
MRKSILVCALAMGLTLATGQQAQAQEPGIPGVGKKCSQLIQSSFGAAFKHTFDANNKHTGSLIKSGKVKPSLDAGNMGLMLAYHLVNDKNLFRSQCSPKDKVGVKKYFLGKIMVSP